MDDDEGIQEKSSIFCENCGAANVDSELGLCPNCLGEVLDNEDGENKNRNIS